ncbi:DUF1287 domain-containing protein [Anaeromicropila herbilytica]|nr:DUF1287 domain-containing protein [Anaeromicropila herbilytica]
MRTKSSKKTSIVCIILVILVITLILSYILYSKKITPKLHSPIPFTATELHIKEIKSSHDEDKDGIDDYTDLFEGAKSYITTKPIYKSAYYEGGYPKKGYGVCTDVIWNAFENAGYHLKDMVDKDIKENLDSYNMIDKPDPNIDFRRVKNLKVFFDRNAEILTTDFSNPEEWQAGDIVVFTKHIAICSDKRNKDGIPFIIHHNGSGAKEANNIDNYEIVGHYRWTQKINKK